MLILGRRLGETLIIEPSAGIDPDMTVRELFASGPMVVALIDMHSNQARIGIQAPDALKVLRAELAE